MTVHSTVQFTRIRKFSINTKLLTSNAKGLCRLEVEEVQ